MTREEQMKEINKLPKGQRDYLLAWRKKLDKMQADTQKWVNEQSKKEMSEEDENEKC